MPTTFESPFAATGADVLLAQTCIDRANFASCQRNAEGTEAVYRYLSGPANAPTIVRVGSYPTNAKGTKNNSIKLTTSIIKTDGDGVETVIPGQTYTFAETDVTNGELDAATRKALAMMAFSVFIQGVGAEHEASETVLNRLQYGESDVLHATMA